MTTLKTHFENLLEEQKPLLKKLEDARTGLAQDKQALEAKRKDLNYRAYHDKLTELTQRERELNNITEDARNAFKQKVADARASAMHELNKKHAPNAEMVDANAIALMQAGAYRQSELVNLCNEYVDANNVGMARIAFKTLEDSKADASVLDKLNKRLIEVDHNRADETLYNNFEAIYINQLSPIEHERDTCKILKERYEDALMKEAEKVTL